MAKVTAERKGLPDHAELFVAGLLHDIGKVFLAVKVPEEYRRVLALASSSRALIVDVEKEVFELTHADPAGWALERWCPPSRLIEPIRYHHEPALANKWFAETAVVHVSDILTRGRGFGFGGDALVPLIDEKARAQLNLSRSEIEAILLESKQPLEETKGFLACLKDA